MRDLLNGSKGFEKYAKTLRRKFIFLNVYCSNVASEHQPRGPKGPFRFQDRSVPVLLFKRWDGETLLQQLGFVPNNPKAGRRSLANYIDKALKKNGPVVPPKALRPLIKAFEKGSQHLEKGRISSAIREFQSVVKSGADQKKFVDGPPDVALMAAEQLTKLEAAGTRQLAETADLARRDPAAARKRFGRIARDYRGLKIVRDAARAALEALPK